LLSQPVAGLLEGAALLLNCIALCGLLVVVRWRLMKSWRGIVLCGMQLTHGIGGGPEGSRLLLWLRRRQLLLRTAWVLEHRGGGVCMPGARP
jgi:hypothetical protein